MNHDLRRFSQCFFNFVEFLIENKRLINRKKRKRTWRRYDEFETKTNQIEFWSTRIFENNNVRNKKYVKLNARTMKHRTNYMYKWLNLILLKTIWKRIKNEFKFIWNLYQNIIIIFCSNIIYVVFFLSTRINFVAIENFDMIFSFWLSKSNFVKFAKFVWFRIFQ